MAQFVAISTIPFLLGVLEPLKHQMSFNSFGLSEGSYFMCIFGSPHAASSIFVCALLILIDAIKKRKFNSSIAKNTNIIFCIILLVSIFKAFVRTGWVMLIVGLFFSFDWKKMNIKVLRRLILFGGCVCFGIIYLYNTNEAFHARITGKNINTGQGGEQIELEGSGRTKFWLNAIEGTWNADSPMYLLFGRGETLVVEENQRKTGMRVFSHNQFLDTFAQNGIIGLLLLVCYYSSLYIFIVKRNSSYRQLCISLFVSSLIFAFFQQELYFFYAFMFSIAIALHGIENNINLQKEMH